MKRAIGGLILAVFFFVAAAVCRSEARLANQLADAHLGLATLQSDTTEIGGMSVWNRVALPGLGSIASDVQQHRATVSYWSQQFDAVRAMHDKDKSVAPMQADPEVQFLAANASFRESAPDAADRKASVERLDGVIQAYADVLRRDPSNADAAYNYEFVSRVRDTLARGGTPRSPRNRPVGDATASVAAFPGATIHGHIGGAATPTDMSDFKTIQPKGGDEREQEEAGQGKVLKRKG